MKIPTVDYRRITESLPQRAYLTSFFLFFLAVLFILSSILAGLTYLSMVEAKNARVEVLDNYNYWREVTDKHPNSPDAFFEVGFYAAELEDRETARKYLDEAVRLDPGFEKAKALGKKIVNSE